MPEMADYPRQPSPEFWSGIKVVVTGGTGFLGSELVTRVEGLGADVRVIRSSEHDLRDPEAAREVLAGTGVVFHLAANVGGIDYNRRNPAPLIHDNTLMALNVFEAARYSKVTKLVNAGSVCAYPKFTPVPFEESHIWDGYPEETNAPYGISKRVVQVLAETYRDQYGLDAVVPVLANLYGPGDNFDPDDSHVIPALVRKFVDARDQGDSSVSIWGSGNASREFLYVGDAAQALLLAAEKLETSSPVNIGTSTETSIRELAEMIRELTGFPGDLKWDESKPDGQPKRSLDTTRATKLLGFQAEVELRDGLRNTIDFWENRKSERD